MRQVFIQTNKKTDALKECPWANKIVKVDGGYRAFESIEDYKTWKNQK